MNKLTLTSPGVLLICATVLAGGIFLLDLFYLHPQVAQQQEVALADQAVKLSAAGRNAVKQAQGDLGRHCRVASGSAELGAARTPADFATFADKNLKPAQAELAWTADGQGNIIHSWALSSELSVPPAALSAAVGKLPQASQSADAEGILLLPDGPVLFARQSLDAPQAPGRALYLARRLETSFAANDLSQAAIFVPGDHLPQSGQSISGHETYWVPQSSTDLNIAFIVTDSTGTAIGYLQLQQNVAQVYRQASVMRRAILIALALSVGLVLLVIAGVHILIAGPVVRLLRRLQQLDANAQASVDLTRDLHGEPLVLARRLESAFNKLAHMSKTDLLTGLSNRRHFEEVLGAFYNQARRYSRPLSLMLIDVDYFKAVNDSAGHQAGDELLKLVASALEKTCRKADLPARWGGDEFAVLMPETPSSDAAAVADRLAELVREISFKVNASEFKITLSIGLADLNAGEIDCAETLLGLADRALYTAKEMGRNRVVQAHDLNSLTWPCSSENSGKVDTLCKKLAGLDSRFQGLFLRAVEEVVGVLEQRDPHMAMHARKVQHFTVLIAHEMGMPNRIIKRLEIAAMLHDIGMIAMPDSILLSPEPLDEQQLQVLRRHPLLSVRIMEGMEFLEQEIPAVRYHHERYDGQGYPEGLKGAQIPLTARVLALADAFVAMTSPRPFRGAMSTAQAVAALGKDSGTQFDPAVVDAFLSLSSRLGEQMHDIPLEGVTLEAGDGSDDDTDPDLATPDGVTNATADLVTTVTATNAAAGETVTDRRRR